MQHPQRGAVLLSWGAGNTWGVCAQTPLGRCGWLTVWSISVSPAEGRVLGRVQASVAVAAAVWLSEEELHLRQRSLIHQEVPIERQH